MQLNRKLTIVISALAVFAAAGLAHGKPGKHNYVMIPAGAASFAPLDSRNPQGLQQAVLSGDPKVGPVAFIMKFPKGRLPVHFHSSDYYGWVVEGRMRHWLAGQEADAKESLPGTFWFQPGGPDTMHDDECMTDSCMLYVVMNGKFDAIPLAASQTPKK